MGSSASLAMDPCNEGTHPNNLKKIPPAAIMPTMRRVIHPIVTVNVPVRAIPNEGQGEGASKDDKRSQTVEDTSKHKDNAAKIITGPNNTKVDSQDGESKGTTNDDQSLTKKERRKKKKRAKEIIKERILPVQPLAFTKSKKKKPKSKKEIKNLLPPAPKTISKYEFINGINFAVVDEHAFQAPYKLLVGSYFDLVEYLTDDDAWDDLVKARVIFRWITSYDIMNMKIDIKPPQNSPLEYFSKIQEDLGSHANLFYILCEIAQLPCVVIEGINKSGAYKVGEPLDREAMKGQWNAVYLYDEWHLVDCFWATACAENVMPDEWKESEKQEEEPVPEDPKSKGKNQAKKPNKKDDPNLAWKNVHKQPVDEHYFLPNPHEIIGTHLPDEDHWQLMKEPITFTEFEDQAFVRERFHQLEMKIADPKYDRCILYSEDGEAEIIFTLPPERSKSCNFRYVIYRSNVTAENRTKLDMLLERFVIFEHLEDMLHFAFRFPISGKFKVEIYGLDKEEEMYKGYDLICAYILIAKNSKDCVPLPDYPAIGWGPNPCAYDIGIEPVSHKCSSITTEDGVLEIVIDGMEEHKLKMLIRNPFADEANIEKYVMMLWDGDMYIVRTRLPKEGMYALKLYAKDPDEAQSPHQNVLNYLIKVTGKDIKNEPFPNIIQGNVGPNEVSEKLGIQYDGKDNGIIYAKDGFTKLGFQKNQNMEFACELHSNSEQCAQRMRVTQKTTEDKLWFHLDLPMKGEYSMNVFAHGKGNFQELYNSHAFLIHSDGRQIIEAKDGHFKSKNFWMGTKPIVAESVYTKNSSIRIPIPRGLENVVGFIERIESNQPASKQNVQFLKEKGVEMFLVELPEYGEYIMNLFQKHERIYMRNIARYHIYRNEAANDVENELLDMIDLIREERIKVGQGTSDLDLRKKAITSKKEMQIPLDDQILRAQRLFQSLESSDPKEIRQALNDILLTQPEPGDILVSKAKKKIRYLEAKEELKDAYSARDRHALDKALAKAKAVNDDHSFDMSILLATRLRDRLKALERLRQITLEVDREVLGEVKRYDNPNTGVHQVIRATLVLLGHTTEEVKDWGKCQTILSRTGNDAVNVRMANFDPRSGTVEKAVDAKDYIEPYTEDQINSYSNGANGFFVWVKRMISEIESTLGSLVKKPKPQLRPKVIEPNLRKKKKEYVKVTMDDLKKPAKELLLEKSGSKVYSNKFNKKKGQVRAPTPAKGKAEVFVVSLKQPNLKEKRSEKPNTYSKIKAVGKDDKPDQNKKDQNKKPRDKSVERNKDRSRQPIQGKEREGRAGRDKSKDRNKDAKDGKLVKPRDKSRDREKDRKGRTDKPSVNENTLKPTKATKAPSENKERYRQKEERAYDLYVPEFDYAKPYNYASDFYPEADGNSTNRTTSIHPLRNNYGMNEFGQDEEGLHFQPKRTRDERIIDAYGNVKEQKPKTIQVPKDDPNRYGKKYGREQGEQYIKVKPELQAINFRGAQGYAQRYDVRKSYMETLDTQRQDDSPFGNSLNQTPRTRVN